MIVMLNACQEINDYGYSDTLESYGLGSSSEIKEMEVFTNPTDPTVAKVSTGDNTEFVFFGEKDEEGATERITYFYTKYPGDDDYYVTMLNDDLLPERVTAPNGFVYEYHYPSDTAMLITIIWPTGEETVSVLFSPGDFNSSWESNSIVPSDRGNIQPELLVNHSDQAVTKAHKGLVGNMSFEIFKCGELVKDASVTLTIEPPITGANYTSDGDKTGNYSFNIPSQSQESNANKLCNSIMKGLTDVCFAYNLSNENFSGEAHPPGVICDKMNKKISAKTELDPTLLTAASAVCPYIVGGFPDFCKLREQLAESGNYETACLSGYEIYQAFTPGVSYVYKLDVSIPGHGTESTELTSFDPNNPGSYSWDVGGEFYLGIIKISGNPSPGGNYSVSCDVVCPVEGGVWVTLTVSGSDGYNPSPVRTEFLQTGTISFSDIPGGKEGVRDVITVVTDKIDGITYESKTSVVF